MQIDPVVIARIFANVNERLEGGGDEWLVLRAEIADVFENDNPNFDRKRFYDACEGLRDSMDDRPTKCPSCGVMTTDRELKTCPMCGGGKRGWRTDCCQQLLQHLRPPL